MRRTQREALRSATRPIRPNDSDNAVVVRWHS
jgi:hypothetical protein